MANKSYGIYYNSKTAIGVEVIGSGRQLKCNTIEAIANSGGSGFEQLTEVARKMSGSTPMAMTVGGALYASYDFRSEFTELQQAAQTLKFDIEDQLAVDAEKIAVCYQEKPTFTSSVDLIVYTANRNELNSVFDIMESEGADPLAAIPSAAAWQTYLKNGEHIGDAAIYLGTSYSSLQIMILDENSCPIICREFPVNEDNIYDTLKRELERCYMTALPGMDIKTAYFHKDNFSLTVLSDITSELDLKLETITEHNYETAMAIGSALAIQKGKIACNFRLDGMEPQSVKKDRDKAKLVMSALVSLILACWVIFNITCTIKYNSMVPEAQKNITAAAKSCNIESQVQNRIPIMVDRTLKDVKALVSGSGSINTQSATTTFNLTLDALSNLNNEFDIQISNMTFKPKEVKPFSGSVPDLEALKVLRETLENKESDLIISQETSNTTNDRQTFEMPLLPMKNARPPRR